MGVHKAYNIRLMDFFPDEEHSDSLDDLIGLLHTAFFERNSPLWQEAMQILHDSSKSFYVRIHQIDASQGAFYADMVINQQAVRAHIGDIFPEYARLHEERGQETIHFGDQHCYYA